MRLMNIAGHLMLALWIATGVPAVVGAQSVTTAELQRLQDDIYDASRQIGQLQERDASLASRLQTELDEARDEVTYLRVKIRKSERVTQSEYADLRAKVASIQRRARGETSGRAAEPSRSTRPSTSRASDPNQVPPGTEFDVRLTSRLSSETAQVEDRVDATTLVDVSHQDDRVLVPAGSVMRGTVNSVQKAGRVERRGSLTVTFDQIRINGRTYPIHATVTQALESEGIRGEAGRIGAGAGVGAILGGILGGLKGALAGILIGGGGTIAATEGTDVDLPAGTVLRVRLDSGLDL